MARGGSPGHSTAPPRELPGLGLQRVPSPEAPSTWWPDRVHRPRPRPPPVTVCRRQSLLSARPPGLPPKRLRAAGPDYGSRASYADLKNINLTLEVSANRAERSSQARPARPPRGAVCKADPPGLRPEQGRPGAAERSPVG